MNTYGLSKGDARGLPTRIPTQNNRFAKLACSLAAAALIRRGVLAGCAYSERGVYTRARAQRRY